MEITNISSLQREVEVFVKQRGILKKDFAREIGVTPVNLSHWLKGRITFNKQVLEKITSALDKSSSPKLAD